MQLQQGSQIAKFHLLRKCGLLAHTSAAFFEKLLHRKNFYLPAARNWKRNLEQMARFLQPAAVLDAKIEKIMRLEKNLQKPLHFSKSVV